MLTYPNCKINIGLRVMDKRKDGYHNLESVMVPVPLYDALEIIENKNTTRTKVSFGSSGLDIPGELNNNLCFKAYTILDKVLDIPPIKMQLHKVIPMGAGLGGGSSDGAFALTLLNELFSLKLNNTQLKKYALQLGSDCPFFMNNTPAFVSGRGEKMKKINLDLNGLHLIIIYPGIHISTAEAFKSILPNSNDYPLVELPNLKMNSWKKKIENDFEAYAFAKYPLLEKIKEDLYKKGALYASMSGSGSALFGLFEEKIRIPKGWEKFFVFQGSGVISNMS